MRLVSLIEWLNNLLVKYYVPVTVVNRICPRRFLLRGAAEEELVPRVQRALEARREKVVYVKGDRDAQYSAIMAAMDSLRAGRIDNIALITEPKAGGRR